MESLRAQFWVSCYFQSMLRALLKSPHPHSTTVFFMHADDAFFYFTGIIKEEFFVVQLDRDMLKLWSDDHLIQMNPTKCRCMFLSRKRLPITFSYYRSSSCVWSHTIETLIPMGVLSWCEHIIHLYTSLQQSKKQQQQQQQQRKRTLDLCRRFYMDPDTIKQVHPTSTQCSKLCWNSTISPAKGNIYSVTQIYIMLL